MLKRDDRYRTWLEWMKKDGLIARVDNFHDTFLAGPAKVAPYVKDHILPTTLEVVIKVG